MADGYAIWGVGQFRSHISGLGNCWCWEEELWSLSERLLILSSNLWWKLQHRLHQQSIQNQIYLPHWIPTQVLSLLAPHNPVHRHRFPQPQVHPCKHKHSNRLWNTATLSNMETVPREMPVRLRTEAKSNVGTKPMEVSWWILIQINTLEPISTNNTALRTFFFSLLSFQVVAEVKHVCSSTLA